MTHKPTSEPDLFSASPALPDNEAQGDVERDSMAPENLFVGPAGWSYEDWRGIVYPPHQHGGSHELEQIAEFFPTVEINSSFYHPPRAEVAAGWLRKVSANPEFVFTAKLFRRFTHERDASAAEERDVKAGLAPLLDAEKLGALLMQFPWSFKNVKEDREYLAGLFLRFQDYPLVVEVRHASWNRPEILEFFHEHNAGFCNLDQPVIGRSLPPTANVTAPVGYVRLHGRNYESWFAESSSVEQRYDYLYSPAELAHWKRRIESIASRSRLTFVILNNHFHGKAAVNALQLRSLLSGKKVPVPQTLLNHYPELEPFAVGPSPEPVDHEHPFELT